MNIFELIEQLKFYGENPDTQAYFLPLTIAFPHICLSY